MRNYIEKLKALIRLYKSLPQKQQIAYPVCLIFVLCVIGILIAAFWEEIMAVAMLAGIGWLLWKSRPKPTPQAIYTELSKALYSILVKSSYKVYVYPPSYAEGMNLTDGIKSVEKITYYTYKLERRPERELTDAEQNKAMLILNSEFASRHRDKLLPPIFEQPGQVPVVFSIEDSGIFVYIRILINDSPKTQKYLDSRAASNNAPATIKIASAKANPDSQATMLTIAYDLDAFKQYGSKIPVVTDISTATNTHISLVGMSGSGKSTLEQLLFYRLIQACPDGEFYFADYKGDDAFAYLRNTPRYYSWKNTLQALDTVYARFNARLSGEDSSRNPITFIWDEYMANMLSLLNEDKKMAATVMNKVSEILLMGRSVAVRLVTAMPRLDAMVFTAGARLNYGVSIILGEGRSIYDMVMPDFVDEIRGRKFGRGEGVCLLQGSELHFIKVDMPENMDEIRALCVKALS